MTNWTVTARRDGMERRSGRVEAPTPLDVLARTNPEPETVARTLAHARWCTASTTLDVLNLP